MKKIINILYIGQHPEIRETVLRLLCQQEDWKSSAVACVADALPLLPGAPWDIVLLGNGIPRGDEEELRNKLPAATKLLQHYGGGSGLLFGEIWQALREDLPRHV